MELMYPFFYDWDWTYAKRTYDKLKQKHGDDEEALWKEFMEFSKETMCLTKDDFNQLSRKTMISMIGGKPIEWN